MNKTSAPSLSFFDSKKQIYTLMLVFLSVLAVLKHLPDWLGTYLLSLFVVLQVYGPIYWLESRGFTIEHLGLPNHIFKILKNMGWGFCFRCCLITFVPFVLCVHLYYTRVLQLHFYFAWPDSLLSLIFTQVLAVALPEELFYRGFVMQGLEVFYQDLTTNKHHYVALLVSSLFFAASHFVGEYHLARLATFFPGLVMGFLYQKTRYLYVPIAYHACANILSEWLSLCYQSN